jgi:hypothetical protein
MKSSSNVRVVTLVVPVCEFTLIATISRLGSRFGSAPASGSGTDRADRLQISRLIPLEKAIVIPSNFPVRGEWGIAGSIGF